MAMDILYMPMTVSGYGYIIVVVDLATNFMYTEAIKNRTPKTIIRTVNRIIQISCRTSRTVETSTSESFIGSATEYLMRTYEMEQQALSLEDSTENEVANMKITNLLRKMLPQGEKWLGAYRSVTYAFNATAMRRNNSVRSPAQLLYGTQPCIPLVLTTKKKELDEVIRAKDVREIMEEITKMRKVPQRLFEDADEWSTAAKMKLDKFEENIDKPPDEAPGLLQASALARLERFRDKVAADVAEAD